MADLPLSFELVTVQSGARSMRSLVHGETFHPVVGPMVEARGLHVEQQRLVERAGKMDGPMVIWDVGLGGAANAIAVLEAARGCQIELHSFDATEKPLAFALKHAAELGYPMPFVQNIQELLDHGRTQMGGIAWHLHLGDFTEMMLLPSLPAPHAMLYDPYSPATNPEMWTLSHFQRLHARLDSAHPCLWTNYTRSTAVRVTLLLAGFYVGTGGATGEKEETTQAANALQLLSCPLDRRWLGRVERSTRSAPLRGEKSGRPISAADLAALRAHPQLLAE